MHHITKYSCCEDHVISDVVPLRYHFRASAKYVESFVTVIILSFEQYQVSSDNAQNENKDQDGFHTSQKLCISTWV